MKTTIRLIAEAMLFALGLTTSAIPLSEIIRVQRAKLEYEKTEYWVYCVWGKMQSDPKDCAKDKANLMADLERVSKAPRLGVVWKFQGCRGAERWCKCSDCEEKDCAKCAFCPGKMPGGRDSARQNSFT